MQDAFETIRNTLGAMYRSEIGTEKAEAAIKKVGAAALAEFIVDAKNRGWISNMNLGLDEDGEPM
jgi:hypothetical protein